MKVAVIGSRTRTIDHLERYLPKECREIVTGGANGVDHCAAQYAAEHRLKLTVFLPEYQKYKKGAPLIRNKQIVDYADMVLAFWDGTSKGTLSVIHYCQKTSKPCQIVSCP